MAGNEHPDSLDSIEALQRAWDQFIIEIYSGVDVADMRHITQDHLISMMDCADRDAPMWDEGCIGSSNVIAEFIIAPDSINVVVRPFLDYVLALNTINEEYGDIAKFIKLE